jgi:hypothetical protein
MQNKNGGKVECNNMNCEYHYPSYRAHYHTMTNSGSYVTFVTEKANKQKEIDYGNPSR